MSDADLKDYGIRKALVNAPIAWQDLRLSEQIHGLRFFRDADNNLVVIPTVLFDPTQAGLGVLPIGRVGISDPVNLSSYARVYAAAAGYLAATLGLTVNAAQMLLNGLNLEPQRTPTTWKAVRNITAAGTTDVWTPVAGKKFRLMGGIITLSKDAAAAALEYISLQDQAATFFYADISSAALVATGNVIVIPFSFPANGYLSAAINNVFRVNLQVALTAGTLAISVWGTEE
jgi:hypothetical protein